MIWAASNPQFTYCFMQTALVWGPAVFLALFALLDLYRRRDSRYSDIPWSFINMSKTLLVVILIALSITDLVLLLNAKSNEIQTIYNVQVVTSSVKIAMFVSKETSHEKNEENQFFTSYLDSRWKYTTIS